MNGGRARNLRILGDRIEGRELHRNGNLEIRAGLAGEIAEGHSPLDSLPSSPKEQQATLARQTVALMLLLSLLNTPIHRRWGGEVCWPRAPKEPLHVDWTFRCRTSYLHELIDHNNLIYDAKHPK